MNGYNFKDLDREDLEMMVGAMANIMYDMMEMDTMIWRLTIEGFEEEHLKAIGIDADD